jgi:hypothetical protein
MGYAVRVRTYKPTKGIARYNKKSRLTRYCVVKPCLHGQGSPKGLLTCLACSCASWIIDFRTLISGVLPIRHLIS